MDSVDLQLPDGLVEKYRYEMSKKNPPKQPPGHVRVRITRYSSCRHSQSLHTCQNVSSTDDVTASGGNNAVRGPHLPVEYSHVCPEQRYTQAFEPNEAVFSAVSRMPKWCMRTRLLWQKRVLGRTCIASTSAQYVLLPRGLNSFNALGPRMLSTLLSISQKDKTAGNTMLPMLLSGGPIVPTV